MSDDELLDELLTRWNDAYNQGRDLSPAELCREAPQLLERAAQEIAKRKSQRITSTADALIPPPTPSMGPPPPPLNAFAGLRFDPQRHHASGGLGDVFVAVDQEVGREVALKRIKPTFADDADCRARFQREAEITGRLEHPGVVPLYGRGRDADGRPYYAMRFIRGRSLRSAIEDFYKPENGKNDPGGRAVAFRGLLQSFTAACNTVAYAHSRGIIHRDLKPDNIMLGPYGETLVVDWGLAKYVGRDERRRDVAEESIRPTPTPNGEGTRVGAVVGTPAFMSPEQALGRPDVGPAGDVFSLGAMLYQLLTGRPPYQGAMALVDAAAGKFPRPRQVRRDVPRALEAVCLRATTFRPEERYQTAVDLARDVDRWLADEPTGAYREPWRVRAWRWVKRHRTPTAATAAALLVAAVLGSVLLSSALAQQAATERGVKADLAEAAQLRDKWRFGEARSVLKRAEDRLSGGGPAVLAARLAQARKDLEMVAELQEPPLMAVPQTSRGGSTDWSPVEERYRKLFHDYGIDVETLDAGEAASRIRASDIREPLIVALDIWASGLPEQNRERLERLEYVAGRADDDEQRRDLRRALVNGDQEDLKRRVQQWDASLNPTAASMVAGRLFRLGCPSSLTEQILRRAQQLHPTDFFLNNELSYTLSQTPSHREEALGFMRAALAVNPDSPLGHYNLANRLQDLGRREEAEPEYRRAIQIKDDHVAAHTFLGWCLAGEGRREEAEQEYRRAIQLREDDPYPHNYFGVLLADEGKRDEAEQEYRRAIQIKEYLPGPHNNLGNLLTCEGRREEAEQEYRRAIQIKDDLPGPHHNRGLLLQRLGRHDEAEKEFRRALQLKEDYPEAHYCLGQVLQQLGRPDEAGKEFRCAVRLYAEAFAQQPALADDMKARSRRNGADGLATGQVFGQYDDIKGRNRYNAACAAALAAGTEEGSCAPDQQIRACLRSQSLDWLRADLKAWDKLRQDDPKAGPEIQQTLQHWKTDGDLAGVRDGDALAKLPQAEREAWRKLWADVYALLAQMDDPK
ncbi:MAG TPA: serine/threonine-protein kinase [Gemmataceae bacterium]|nr:serine/threonine-protein kinase [Gemmataceae bacterium]